MLGLGLFALPWLVPLGAVRGAPAAAAATSGPFHVEVLAEGVSLFRPVEASSERTNSLVIERQDGLLVVESQPTPQSARELLDAIASQHGKPVRYLVLSHPHAESAGGASAFPDATLIVASAGHRAALQDGEHDFGAEMRRRSADPASWISPPRAAPRLVVHALVEFDDPGAPVSVAALPHAHTRGDLLVWLPRQRVYYLGPLLFIDGNPYAAGARMDAWLGFLNDMAKQPAGTIFVPLRGPTADSAGLRRNRDALAWVEGHVEAGFVDRLPLPAIRQKVLETQGLEERFDVHAAPSFLADLVDGFVEQGLEHRRKRGLM